jgi:peptide/nickel transport system ATP-binding protein
MNRGSAGHVTLALQWLHRDEGRKGDLVALLEVKDLHTQFRTREGVVRAVDGVTFELNARETLGLVGESGCGKSVTALSLMRLISEPAGKIASGRIIFDGQDIVTMDNDSVRRIRGAKVAMIFQDPMTSLNPVLTIGRQISEALELHLKMDKAGARERAVKLLELVGIPSAKERLDNYPHQFSGGMRQRAMIAMALSCNPKLVIADEVTTALDVTIQAQILELLKNLADVSGTAVILITHDLGIVAGMAQRVHVMYAGAIVEKADTVELFANPKMPYTWGLLRSVSRLDEQRKEHLVPIEGLPPDLISPPPGCPFAPRCQYRRDICSERMPDLIPVPSAKPDHEARCWGTQDVPGGGWLVDVDWRREIGDLRTLEEIRQDAALVPTEAVSVMPLGPRDLSASEEVRTRATTARTTSPQPAEPVGARTLLEVSGLTMQFALTEGTIFRRNVGTVRAVDGIDLFIKQGETLGLVGESGCGKSTTGRAIMQLYKPTSGSVKLDGIELTMLGDKEMRRVRRRMQMIFQDPYASLNPRMTVGNIIGEPLEIHDIARGREKMERVQELLRLVGLNPKYTNRYAHEFSGGQRQRIGIARALAVEPQFIVADEPISALDVSIQAQIINLLEKLKGEFKLTYLFIAHDLAVVRHISDRVAVMYLGKIVELAERSDLYARPLHPYTEALLSAAPIPDPHIEALRKRIILPGDVASSVNPPSGCRFRTRCWLREKLGDPDICSTTQPDLVEHARGHWAACHFAGS